jgi:hypothetical protein
MYGWAVRVVSAASASQNGERFDPAAVGLRSARSTCLSTDRGWMCSCLAAESRTKTGLDQSPHRRLPCGEPNGTARAPG